MEIIAIPDELMAELEQADKEIVEAQAGLDYFASTLKAKKFSLWKIIREAFPDTKGWVLRLDRDKKTITKLHPE